METCKDYREGAPLTSHQWVQDATWGKLLCTECGAGLSEEGVVQLAIDYQAESKLRAAETLCKIYFGLAIESGWSEENLRAERDKRIDAAKGNHGEEAE